MNIIGITGSSGAGKSTVCDILERKYNVKVINADKIARHLSKKGTSYISEIVDKFGKDILDEYGELKRKKLAEMIYKDAEKRKLLNKCTFKYIKKEIQNEIDKIKKEDNNITIIIDAPLLYECELDNMCDMVIGIISQKELQIDRIVKRDDIDYEHAKNRLNAQEDNEFYISRCDEIIENNNDINHIEMCIEKIVQKYIKYKK